MPATRPLHLASSHLTLDVIPGQGIELITDRDIVTIPGDELLSMYAWIAKVLGSPRTDARPAADAAR